MSNLHEEEALGKAYDSRLMRRLLQYMKPYRWRVALALVMVAVVTPLELAPPALGVDPAFTRRIERLYPGRDYLAPLTKLRDHGSSSVKYGRA